MSKVWIVTSGEYSDYRIEGVFSTLEAAEAFRAGNVESDTQEWDLDVRAQERYQMVYSAQCILATGHLQELCSWEKWGAPDYHKVSNDGRAVNAESVRSMGHALKLAIEGWQAWLREAEASRFPATEGMKHP